ncbi:hypothetical protein GZH53_12565 [Flavihumibacter sp. R14]|nr:hypothetical protein [Flavihumibacter soli]
MDSYKAGSGQLQILLSTDITTIGLAGSRATVFVPGSGNPSVPVAHSVDATGDIPISAIGLPSSLKGKRISIMSKIDLSIVGDQEAREKEFNKLVARYFLDGGPEHLKKFEANFQEVTHSDDFNTVLIFKAINIV